MTNPSPKERLLAQRALARRRLSYFTRMTLPSYSAGWVHEDICRRLERFSADVIAKKSPRLMLLLPPRSGKSELASIRFPAWHLGHAPNHEIINAGYNLDLPMIFSRKVRELLRTPVYQTLFPGTALDPDSQGAEAWRTTTGGGFCAAGVGGGITGKGAHCLIVDDPLKNLEEADNAERRDLLEGWYQSTAYTRLAPGGGVLFIETWWNDDDLAGRLQAHAAANAKADQFEVVKYPAISEQHEWRHRQTLHIVRTKEPELDKETLVAEAVRMKMIYPEHYIHDEANVDASQYDLIRRPNEALHPERYDLDALLRIKNTVEPRIWSALYQQNPVPDEGMYFQKSYFRYQPSMPRFRGLRLFTAWDFAIGQKQANDWTVGVTLLQDENDVLYVIDVERFRGDTYTIVDRMLAVAERFATEHTLADYMIGVEDGQIWKSVEPVFSKVMMERGKFIAYETMKPFTDKLARARPLQGRMQQGRVVFPAEAHWLGQTEQELLRFPAGAHDDVVDALAWAVRLCLGKAAPTLAEAKPFRSWKDDLETGGDSGASHMCA